MKSRTPYLLIGAFAVGIAAQELFPLGVSGGAFFILLGGIFLAGGKFEEKRGKFERAHGKNQDSFFFSPTLSFSLALFLLAFGAGIGRMAIADVSHARDMSELEKFAGEKVLMEGVIDDEPDRRENSTLLLLRPEKIMGEITEKNTEGKITGDAKILLTADRLVPAQYGDRVRIEGKLKFPENFETHSTNGGREFDYISYLEKDGISFVMAFPKISLIGQGEGNLVKEKLFALKAAFLGSINRVIPEPSAGLLGGVLLGTKHAMGKDALAEFRAAGLVHIVVLSGYNITLVIEWALVALAFLPRVWGMMLAGLFAIFFVLMTGANAATVRAAAMAILALSARHFGRESDGVRVLCIVAFLMLLWNPRSLLSDPSFQLSLAATLGLLLFSPKISKWLEHFHPAHLFRGGLPEGVGGVKVSPMSSHAPALPSQKGRGLFRTIVSDTLATQIAVSPLLLWMTGMVSLAALPANLLAIPLVPFAMAFGFFAGLAGFISPLLALPFAAIANLLLSALFLIAHFFASLPWAVVGA